MNEEREKEKSKGTDYYSYVQDTPKTIKHLKRPSPPQVVYTEIREKRIQDIEKESIVLNEKPLHASEVQRKKSKGDLLRDGIIEDM